MLPELGTPNLTHQLVPDTLSIAAVQTSVSDPVTEGFGPRRYTTYLVVTDVRESILSSFPAGELALASGVTCRRRFSEFLKLRGDLLDACPGVIIPPLPEKQTVGRFEPEFVEKRRRALSSFLGACASHPIIATSVLLANFAEWPGALRSCVVSLSPVNYVPSADWARLDGGDPLKSAPADVGAFEAQARKLREVLKREHVRELERSIDLMVASQAYAIFGQTDFNLSLRPTLCRASAAMGTLSTLLKTQAECDQRTVLALLKEYKHLAIAIGEQCKRREALQKTLEHAQLELRTAQTALGRATGKASLERKAAELEAKVADLGARAQAAHEQLALFNRTLSVELARFHAQKNLDFSAAIGQFAAEHVRSTLKVVEAWRAMMPESDADNQLGGWPPSRGGAAAGASTYSQPQFDANGGGRGGDGLQYGAGAGDGQPLSFMQALQQSTPPPYNSMVQQHYGSGGSVGAGALSMQPIRGGTFTFQ